MQSTLILLIQGQDFTGQRGWVYGKCDVDDDEGKVVMIVII